jgi:formylglycine-generating enzyme required for sulfatase activity
MPSATGWWASEGSVNAALRAGVHPLEDAQAMRSARRDLLSLALIDARNHLLALLAQEESPAALRRAAHAGWYQETWIARHVQRQRGEACDPRATRLAGIEPRADAWAAGEEAPPPGALRSYLAETLEVTLDLLAGSAEDDAALHFFRLSLLHEDRLCEALAEDLRATAPPSRAVREPIWLPATRWMLGSTPGGLVPHNERWAHEAPVPESEIDAQAVNWGQFAEFAADGGYERRELWFDAGWAWLQAGGRRAPAHVEQLLGGVLVQRRGGLQRVPALQPVMHANRFEAEAWCRWAGRRLPTEPDWELAAHTAASRGFMWGDVFEWVAGSARAWPGSREASPGSLDAIPPAGTHGVLRGASFATRARQRHPKARRFAPPDSDSLFCGFRSCAL